MTLFIVTDRNKQGLIRIWKSVTPECTPLECHPIGDSIGGDRHSTSRGEGYTKSLQPAVAVIEGPFMLGEETADGSLTATPCRPPAW